MPYTLSIDISMILAPRWKRRVVFIIMLILISDHGDFVASRQQESLFAETNTMFLRHLFTREISKQLSSSSNRTIEELDDDMGVRKISDE